MATPTKARENPFRSERVAAFRYQIDAEKLASWTRRIRTEESYHLSIVGPMGTGKTVLLEDLFRKVGRGSWLKVRREDSLRSKLRAAFRLIGRDPSPVFADGLESVSPFLTRWGPLLRPRILATFHRPRTSFEVLLETRFDRDIAKRLLEFLLDRPLSPEQVEAIRQNEASSGNMRDLIRSLYLSTANPDPS